MNWGAFSWNRILGISAVKSRISRRIDIPLIRIPLEKPKPSSSGKTLIVASTGGNVQTAVEVNGKPVFLD